MKTIDAYDAYMATQDLPREAIVPVSLLQDLFDTAQIPLANINFSPSLSGYKKSDVYDRVCDAMKVAESDLIRSVGQDDVTVAAWVLNEITSFSRLFEKLNAVTARIESRKNGLPDPVEKTSAKFKKLERFIAKLDTTYPENFARVSSMRPR